MIRLDKPSKNVIGGVKMISKGFSTQTERINILKAQILNAKPCVESERAILITE